MENHINAGNQNSPQVDPNLASQSSELPTRPKVNYWLILSIVLLLILLGTFSIWRLSLRNSVTRTDDNNVTKPLDALYVAKTDPQLLVNQIRDRFSPTAMVSSSYFTWKIFESDQNLEPIEKIIAGHSYTDNKVDYLPKLREFIESQGFTYDGRNSGVATIQGQDGYMSGNIVCIVGSKISDDKKIDGPSDIKVSCGDLSQASDLNTGTQTSTTTWNNVTPSNPDIGFTFSLPSDWKNEIACGEGGCQVLITSPEFDLKESMYGDVKKGALIILREEINTRNIVNSDEKTFLREGLTLLSKSQIVSKYLGTMFKYKLLVKNQSAPAFEASDIYANVNDFLFYFELQYKKDDAQSAKFESIFEEISLSVQPR